MSDARPLAILLVGDYPDDPRLGSSKVFHKLQEEFHALGHTCDVVWADEIGSTPRGRQVRQVLSPWMAARAIARRLRRRQYDVVDAASAEGLGFAARRMVRRSNRPALICRSNGLEQLNYARMLEDARLGLTSKSWYRRLWYPMTRLNLVAAAAKAADRLLVLNEQDRRYAVAQGWQHEDAIVLVPHGISDRFLAESPDRDSPRGAGLLFCGSWDRTKGTPYLVGAVDALHARGVRAKLTVLGPGVPAAIVVQSFSEAARPFITVIDRVAEARVMEEYRRHDVLVWPSTYEGFGLVVVEAMSQRLPAIATPVGCATSVIRNGENGVLVAPRDPHALAAAVQDLLASAERRRAMGDAAHDTVSLMSWRATARATLHVYEAALAERRA